MKKKTVSAAETLGIIPRKKPFLRKAYDQRQLLILCLPFMIFIVLFNYLPIWGWITAFQSYVPSKGVFGSTWVGLANFKEAFSDPNFLNAIKNSLFTSTLKIATNFIASILLALMLNEVRNMFFKRTVQTISYLPYFVSWVVTSSIVYMVLSPADGIVNILLMKMGVVNEGIAFMGDPKYFYGVAAISNVWKNVGWNAIIYLSAMTGIDQELYEAAAVDGAGRLRRILAVTLPSIMPTIKILLVMSIGNLMNAGFEQVYLLSNASNISASRTIDVYVYTYALRGGRFSYGTAIGIFNSAISIFLIMVSNTISKRIDGEGIF